MASFDPAGRFIATASADRSVQLWRYPIETGEKSLQLPGRARSVAFSQTSRTIVVTGLFPEARIWDPEASRESTLSLPTGTPVKSLAISHDGSRIACGGRDGGILVHDRNTAESVSLRTTDPSAANAIALSPDARFIATGCQNGMIRVWRRDRLDEAPFEFNLKQPIARLRFSPDGSSLVALARTVGRMAIVSLNPAPSAKAVYTPTPALFQSLTFHPDGDRFLAACTDRRARVFSTSSRTSTAPEFRHDDLVFDAVYDPVAKHVATASKDRSARIWDAESGRLVGRPLTHESAVYRVKFSSDGRLLATGTQDGVVRVWRIDSGLPVLTARLHTEQIISVEFIDGGTRLLSVGSDGLVKGIPIHPVPEGSETWLPDLAEAAGGLRLDDQRLLQPVPRDVYPSALENALKSPFADLFSNWRLNPFEP